LRAYCSLRNSLQFGSEGAMKDGQRDGGNFRLDGKGVFIAGAGGLGGAIARGVSEAGAKVFLADLDLAAAEKVAGAIRKKKRPCQAYGMDILNPAQITDAMRCGRLTLRGMDVALNCTGVNIRKPSLKVTEEDWIKCWM